MNALLAQTQINVTLEELAKGDIKTCTFFADLWIDGKGCTKCCIERKFYVDLKHLPMNSILMGHAIVLYGIGHELRCMGATTYTGNLMIKFKVQEHPIYHPDLTGMFPYDLSSTIYITLLDFFKGQSFYAIPSPTGQGEPIMVEYISGKRVCVKKCCGLQGKGDVYFYFDVVMPFTAYDRQETLRLLKQM
jgi:hypothetical protein